MQKLQEKRRIIKLLLVPVIILFRRTDLEENLSLALLQIIFLKLLMSQVIFFSFVFYLFEMKDQEQLKAIILLLILIN